MSETVRIHVVSDIHYASPAEQERRDFDWRDIPAPFRRRMTRFYQRLIWMRDPFAHNHLVGRFCAAARESDYVISNGDHCCDSAFLGVSDDAAHESARLCLAELRAAFGERLHATIGDHELGKLWLHGQRGGMRLESWRRCVESLKIRPFWRIDAGVYTVLGVTSTLIALPVFQHDADPAELPQWELLREAHLAEIRHELESVTKDRRLILFVHDPTALPFLHAEPAAQAVLPRLELTIIGHLHTPIVFQTAKLLAGIPPVHRLGAGIRRMSTALNRAHAWKPFHVRLCPSLAGIELHGHGGYGKLEIDPSGQLPLQWRIIPLPR